MQKSDHANSLRLASYNIRKAVGLDYRRDPVRIARILREIDADIVAIQEADKRLGDRPAALDVDTLHTETDLIPVPLVPETVSIGWHGNAILLRKGIMLRQLHQLTLPGLEPRGALKVVLETKLGTLTVVASHLGLVRPYRRLQLATICENLDPAEMDRTIILGDFNEWHQSRGLEPLQGDFDVLRPGKSFHSALRLAGLDRIALGKGCRALRTGVVRNRLTRVASDHLPIFADVVVGHGPKGVDTLAG